MTALLAIAVILILYGAVSGPVDRRGVTSAIFFVTAGLVAGASGLIDVEPDSEVAKRITELALVLLLFSDSIRLNLRTLRHDLLWPSRLLLIGLPLTMAVGVGAGLLVLPGLGLAGAFLLATMLCATDAALGQRVVEDPAVPARVRQALDVESGLNDGLAVPFFLVALDISLATLEGGLVVGRGQQRRGTDRLGSGRGDRRGRRRRGGLPPGRDNGWLLERWRQVFTLAVALSAYAAALALGGSGFIAAFVAGMAFGGAAREHGRQVTELTEETGNVLAAVTWVGFGAVALTGALADLTWREVAYALLSLTVIRMLPVAIALVHTGARWPTTAFMGWFGPRGLASVVFGLMALEHAVPQADTLLDTVSITVGLSVFLHGLTAPPLVAAYHRWYGRAGSQAVAAEGRPTRLPRTRHPTGHHHERSPGTSAEGYLSGVGDLAQDRAPVSRQSAYMLTPSPAGPEPSSIISAMDEPTPRPRTLAGLPAERFPALLAGVSGCLLLIVWTSRWQAGLPSFIHPTVGFTPRGVGWGLALVPIAATVVGLCTPRWWPYQLLAGGLLATPGTLAETVGLDSPTALVVLSAAGYPLTLLGVLACAQSVVRDKVGVGAAIAGLSMGARLFGAVLVGAAYLRANSALPAWHAVLVVVALAGLFPAALSAWRGDPAAVGPPDAGRWSWRRIRPVVAGGLAACAVIPLMLLTTERLASLLGVTESALVRHGYVEAAMIGAALLVTVTVLSAMAGVWSLAGALTAAVIHVAVMAPMVLVLAALPFDGSVGCLGALAGVILGVVAACVRWRVPLAAALTVLAAMALFTAYAATTGHPEKLAEQQSTVPALLILILIVAAATAVIGATAPVLAPHGTLPAVLGPLAGGLAVGAAQAISVTYVRDGSPTSSYLNSVFHLPTSAVLLLVAGAAIAGLGFAQQVSRRRAERAQTEQIRREAAAAERDRLARPIHDGVLQVLALVQRRGSELGEQGSQLAELAGEQEVALRTLLTGGGPARHGGVEDLRTSLAALASPAIEVAAPAEPVTLPATTAAEVTAAVRATLDNVRRHAGPGARAWVLLEDEGDGVRICVRDDGIGFPADRLAEAEAAGRLGVAQSIRGRVTALGGTTTVDSRPGEGTEFEFWVPRRPRTAD